MIPEETAHRPSVLRDLEHAAKTPVQETGLLAHYCGNADAPVRGCVGCRVPDLPQHQRPILHEHVRFSVASRDGVVGTGACRPGLNGPVPREVGYGPVGVERGGVRVGAEVVA